jgi:dCMP deaminase
LYVSLFPCNECAKAIIQSGIKEIVYELDLYAKTENVMASKRMLKAAGVKTRIYRHAKYKITIDV